MKKLEERIERAFQICENKESYLIGINNLSNDELKRDHMCLMHYVNSNKQHYYNIAVEMKSIVLSTLCTNK